MLKIKWIKFVDCVSINEQFDGLLLPTTQLPVNQRENLCYTNIKYNLGITLQPLKGTASAALREREREIEKEILRETKSGF